MIREVAVRYRGARRSLPLKIDGPKAVAKFAEDLIDGDSREHLVALFLGGRHQPIGYRTVSIGTATASLMHPREIFQGAILAGAVALILIHNHPSGDPTPTGEDIGTTERIAEAGELLGIPLLDHLIVGQGCFCSIKETAPELLKPKGRS
jgi:DNA repair protein RadC